MQVTISDKIEVAIQATTNQSIKSGLSFLLKKLVSHRYGVDIASLPYDALECDYVNGRLAFVINMAGIPADFEVLAQVGYTDGYQEMFSKSIEVLEYESVVREKGDITLEVAKLVSGKRVIIPAKEFNDIVSFYWLFLNSGIEPHGNLSNFLLEKLRVKTCFHDVSERHTMNKRR